MKQKTKKSLSKKVKVTGSGKITRRSTKQNHYNSRATGNANRGKKRDRGFFKADEANIVKALPNA
ncbi:MAG: 50S ribosomal protein L35 [Candidatus Moranbacteria bacterium]|jgi:ribosomal protein L35|nr:50S ribosomal protein L35 [Candidatus Moranbacteria bacterium]